MLTLTLSDLLARVETDREQAIQELQTLNAIRLELLQLQANVRAGVLTESQALAEIESRQKGERGRR